MSEAPQPSKGGGLAEITRFLSTPWLRLFAYVMVLGSFAGSLTSQLVFSRLAHEQQRYVEVEGRVVAARVEPAQQGAQMAAVETAYEVGGHPLTTVFRKAGTGTRDAAAIVADHPPGSSLTLYYNPDAPDEVVLHPLPPMPISVGPPMVSLLLLVALIFVDWRRVAAEPEIPAAADLTARARADEAARTELLQAWLMVALGFVIFPLTFVAWQRRAKARDNFARAGEPRSPGIVIVGVLCVLALVANYVAFTYVVLTFD